MLVYRIAKSIELAKDLSGFGAYKYGGRWNSKGTFMLYTSINSSLAYLENLVHFDESDMPPNLYIIAIEIQDKDLIYELPDPEYPTTWQKQDNLENKLLGDEWMAAKEFIAIKVRSAINPSEFNFLLNPLFPGFYDKAVIRSVDLLNIDARLIR